MDLNEAEKSLDYFANLLEMQCALLSSASEMEVTAGSTEMASRARELSKKLLADLELARENSQMLDILICEEMGREAQNFICAPKKLTRVIAASNRLVQVSHHAKLLIEEQKKKLAQKAEPNQPSATSLAIREFLREHEIEEAGRQRAKVVS